MLAVQNKLFVFGLFGLLRHSVDIGGLRTRTLVAMVDGAVNMLGHATGELALLFVDCWLRRGESLIGDAWAR